MAASTYSIILSNGQTISVYQASSQGVNTSPVCTLLGAAGSTTTTTDFSVSSDACVVDIQVAAALTSGGIEVYPDGVAVPGSPNNVSQSNRTQKGWANLETFLSTNTTRRPAKVCFRRGQIYRFVQTVAGNA